MNQQLRNYIFMFSAILVFAGSLLYITHWFYACYMYAIGASGVAVCFMTAPYKHLSFRLRRLHRINVLAGISLVASSIFMFRRTMEWVVFLLISTLFFLYTSFVSPRPEE